MCCGGDGGQGGARAWWERTGWTDCSPGLVYVDTDEYYDGVLWLAAPRCITLIRTKIWASEVGLNYSLGF